MKLWMFLLSGLEFQYILPDFIIWTNGWNHFYLICEEASPGIVYPCLADISRSELCTISRLFLLMIFQYEGVKYTGNL
jgi:hypothetical protein